MSALIIRPLRGWPKVHGLRAPRGKGALNKEMFKTAADAAIRPTWVYAPEGQPYWHGYWTISRNHLNVVAEANAIRDGEVVVEMHYSEREQCDLRCQNATGDDCTCFCEGKHHGEGVYASWKEVGATTRVRSTGVKVVTRVLTWKDALKQQRRRTER